MRIRFKIFASILIGIWLIGFALGLIIANYITNQYQSNIWIYIAAPILGMGSSLIIYGTLYGRNLK